MPGYVLVSTMAADALVLKYQAISIHNTNLTHNVPTQTVS